MGVGLHIGGKHTQGFGRIANHGHIGLDDLAHLGRINVEMDDFRLFGIGRDFPRYPVIEAHAHSDDQVGFVCFDVRSVIAMHPQHPHVQGVIGGQRRQSQQGPGRRNPRLFHEVTQFLLRPRNDYPLSEKQQRFLGRVNQFGRLLHLERIYGNLGKITADLGTLLIFKVHLPELGIFGDVKQDGAWAAGLGNIKGLGDGPGDFIGRGDLEIPFGDRYGNPDHIRLLKSIGSEQG